MTPDDESEGMPTVRLSTRVDAPRERVFDLARSVDLHVDSMADTDEEAVAGVTSGLLGPGDDVRWRGTHFWLGFELSVRVVEFDRPNRFRDVMTDGPFARLSHDHVFENAADGTSVMRDAVSFRSPFWPVGWLTDQALVEDHLTDVLTERNVRLREVAESDEWRDYLPANPSP